MTTEETRARIKEQAAELRQQVEAREARRQKEEATPPAFLSISEGRYRVISQGMPICADKPTPAEALTAAKHQRVIVAPVAWNGDRAQWVHLDTIEELDA
jgi:ribosome-interacting GTPase 1